MEYAFNSTLAVGISDALVSTHYAGAVIDCGSANVSACKIVFKQSTLAPNGVNYSVRIAVGIVGVFYVLTFISIIGLYYLSTLIHRKLRTPKSFQARFRGTPRRGPPSPESWGKVLQGGCKAALRVGC